MLFSCHLWKVKLRRNWSRNNYEKNIDVIIRTIVAATCPVLGLSPLDDGRHRHHRFLLLHHLARLLARSTFTRHRGPIYLVSFLLSFAHAHPPEARHPAFFSLRVFVFSFFQSFFLSYFSLLFKNGSLVPSLPRHLANRRPSFHLVLPSLARAKFLLLVSIWYGCSLHFFGSFVIDRATGYLTILQQKEEWFGGEQKEILTDGRTDGRKPIKILHRIIQRPRIPHSYWWASRCSSYSFSENSKQ